MPTPPLSDEELLRTLEVRARHRTNQDAGEELGLNDSTVSRHVRLARERGLHLSEGARQSMHNAGLSGGEIRGGWIHNYDDEGKKTGTTRWTAPDVDAETIIDQIREAFTGIPPAPVISAPDYTTGNLATVYPLMDVHLGLMAWGKETGGPDYDLKIAQADMHYAFGKILTLTPPSDTAILIIGGDFFHADDTNNQTPAHKHTLDVDGRHFKIADTGVSLLSAVVENLLHKHRSVIVRVLRGNHDEHMHVILTFALSERYRDNERVEVEKDPRDLFMRQWGRCLIAAHHGDKAPPERLTLYLSDVCPYWSETRHRHCFTGHIHKDQAKDIGPLKWESLRAFTPPDSYAAGMGYSGRRAMQALTFDKQDGLVLRAMDPIERVSA